MNIDLKQFENHKQRLQRISKNAYPFAVRSTLNDLAFKNKKDTNNQTGKYFEKRNKTFFKRFTEVQKSERTYDINKMQASNGYNSKGIVSARTAIDGLYKQEYGGVSKKGYQYLKDSRTSSSLKKMVRKKDYFNKSNVIKKSNNFLATAYNSKKKNKPFFITSKSGKPTLIQTVQFKKTKKGIKIKNKVLMSKRQNVRIQKTNFREKIGIFTHQETYNFFIKNFKRINK